MQKNIVFVIGLCLAIQGCNMITPFKPDVSQGNVIEEDKVALLKTGMTKEQVLYIMGTPVLEESLDPNRWDYVATFKPAKGNMEKKRLSLYFIGNQLVKIEGIYYQTQEKNYLSNWEVKGT